MSPSIREIRPIFDNEKLPVVNHARIALRALRPLFGYLRFAGKDPERLLKSVGIEPTSLFDPVARIPHPVFLKCWSRAEEFCDDPNLGLRVVELIPFQVLERLQFESEWTVVQLFAVSRTVGEGLSRLVEFFPVGFYGSNILIERRERLVHVHHRVVGPSQMPRSFSEFILALIVRQLHVLPDRPVKPREIRFTHVAPESAAAHERILAAPVRFSSEANVMVLGEADLDVPLRSYNPALLLQIERRAKEQIAQLPALGSLVDQVRALIVAELPEGNLTAEHAAATLQMSVRTLSRKLQDSGTSHKMLLDEIRASLAQQYLLHDRRSAQEVAELLGFSEVSAFHRAFRRWFGQTPSDFRREHSGS